MNRKNMGLPSTSNIKDEATKRVLDSIINALRQIKKEVDILKQRKTNR